MAALNPVPIGGNGRKTNDEIIVEADRVLADSNSSQERIISLCNELLDRCAQTINNAELSNRAIQLLEKIKDEAAKNAVEAAKNALRAALDNLNEN